MNYRHAFHAGSFTDVFKHAVLARILVYLTRKEAPFRFIDTHAGAGRYDLASVEADTLSRLVRDRQRDPAPVFAMRSELA
jgi:23S rRNA A2030 N6-methylase RlmJ